MITIYFGRRTGAHIIGTLGLACTEKFGREARHSNDTIGRGKWGNILGHCPVSRARGAAAESLKARDKICVKGVGEESRRRRWKQNAPGVRTLHGPAKNLMRNRRAVQHSAVNIWKPPKGAISCNQTKSMINFHNVKRFMLRLLFHAREFKSSNKGSTKLCYCSTRTSRSIFVSSMCMFGSNGRLTHQDTVGLMSILIQRIIKGNAPKSQDHHLKSVF